FFTRLRDLTAARGVTGSQRADSIAVQWAPDAPAMHVAWRSPPAGDALRDAAARAATAVETDTAAAFPCAADAAVRLQRAARSAEGLGPWSERKYHFTGVLAYRQAPLAAVDRRLHAAAPLPPAP